MGIDELIRTNAVVIIQFGTETCAPCKAIREKLNAWGTDHPEVTIRYIPIEEYPEAAAQRNILSAPTVCLYLNGKPALQQAGYFSLEEFLDKTERYLSLMYRS